MGGMAELFLAIDTEANERVVIKRILPYLSQEEEFVQMFLDEARIASQLHHPNIVRLHELGKLEEQIFIAMEYVDGVDLRKVLQEEAKSGRVVSYRAAAWISAQVCAGLFHAHHRIGRDGVPMNIVHRDVSPQNVMIGFDGRVKLVDFGIAKAGALVERSKPGVIKGKFLYLAPEQLTNERIDHRADLFALGTMLYEVTTGKAPFFKPTSEAVIYAIRTENPADPTTLRSDYPPRLSEIVMRCLEKDRNARYQEAAEIQADLERFLAEEGPIEQAEVSRYVRRVMGQAEEPTAYVVPKAGVLEPGRPPPPVDDAGPTNPTGEVDDGREEPKTQMARPDELAKAMRAAGVVEPPPQRKPQAQPYPTAGEVIEATTTERSADPMSKAPLPSPGRPTLLDRGARAAPPPTRGELRTATGPIFDPPPELAEVPKPAKPNAGSVPTMADRMRRSLGDPDDYLATADYRGSRSDLVTIPARISSWVAERPLAVAGAFGLGALLLSMMVLTVWFSASAKPAESPAPTKAAQAADSAPDAAVAQQAVVPEPPAPTPAPVPVPVVEEPKPTPPPKVTSPVVFRAPSGTRISHQGGNYVPGKTYSLPLGKQNIAYRCPAKKGQKSKLQYKEFRVVAPKSGAQLVRLCQ